MPTGPVATPPRSLPSSSSTRQPQLLLGYDINVHAVLSSHSSALKSFSSQCECYERRDNVLVSLRSSTLSPLATWTNLPPPPSSQILRGFSPLTGLPPFLLASVRFCFSRYLFLAITSSNMVLRLALSLCCCCFRNLILAAVLDDATAAIGRALTTSDRQTMDSTVSTEHPVLP